MKGGFQYGNMDKEISENVNTDTCHLPRYRLHGILKCAGSYRKSGTTYYHTCINGKKGKTITNSGKKILYVRHKKSCVQGKHSDDVCVI